MAHSKDEHYSDEEAARRFDAAIRRALNTPPTPQKEMVGRLARRTEGGGSAHHVRSMRDRIRRRLRHSRFHSR